jgi:hypothetical protein
MLWSVAALGLALAITPLYVNLCHSLARATGRGAHRIVATGRGTAELERLRAGEVSERAFDLPELPGGKCEVTLSAGPSADLKEAAVTVTWDEGGVRARSEWTTLVATR